MSTNAKIAAGGVASSASPRAEPARVSSCGLSTSIEGFEKYPFSPTGDWPENRLNFLPSARNARSTASVPKSKPPRPVMTFLVVSMMIGSAAARTRRAR